MRLRLIHQFGERQELEYFSSPVELEYRYFELSRQRHECPSAIKIQRQAEIIPPAYYRLDAGWTIIREQNIERIGLWADRASEYTQPTEAQIRAVGKFIGSGARIGELAGFTDREWRYLVSGERKMSFARWRLLLQLAGLAGPIAQV
jgi:hypothetical protein